MRYRVPGVRAVALCSLAVLGLMLLAGASAQAEGNWRIKGKNLTETVKMAAEKDSELYSFLVPSLNIALVFENFEIDDGLLFTGGTGYRELLFTEGKLYTISPFQLVKNCSVGDLVFKLKDRLFLHEGKTYDVMEPAEGTTMTMTSYGELCPVEAEEMEVTGSMVWEDVSGEFEEEAEKHLVRQAPAKLFPTLRMLFGVNDMTLDGSMWLKLIGAHAGMGWSALG